MRAKYTLYLSLFVVLFITVSQCVYGQATFSQARHETASQTQILVTLNSPGVTFPGTAPYSTVGWEVEVAGTILSVTSISPFGSNILVTFDASGVAGHGGTQPFVKPGETLRVRYNGGGLFNAAALTPFGFQQSQNNTPFTCAELAFFQQGNFTTVDVCSPVVMNFQQYQYKVSLKFRNSTLFTLSKFRTNIVWGDASTTLGISFYVSNLTGAADATFIENTGFSGNPGIVLTQRPTKNYPAANPTDCSFNASITPLYDGVAFCNSLATTSIFATYDTDNANSGVLSLPPSVVGSDLVCLGNNVNMRFTDATQLNCRVGIEPTVPNDLARHIRIVYGSTDNGGVGNIPDTWVTLPAATFGTQPAVQITNNNPTGTFVAGAYTPTNIGPADFNGVIALPTPVTAASATAYMGQITTTLTNNQAVGQRFYVRLEYWDICNPYNAGNPNSPAPVTIENFVQIIDSPNPPTVTNPTLCETAADASFNITATGIGAGTLTYTWYRDAALTQVLQGPSTDNTFNPVTEGPTPRITKAVTGSQTFTRYVTVTQGSNNCTSQPQTITIRIDDTNTAGVIAHPDGASPITVCTGYNPGAFTSTTPGTGGEPGGTFTYQWQSATNAAFSAGVTNIPATNSATYDPPAITSTTYFRRQVISGSCATVNSNIIGFLVDTPVLGGTIAGTQTICANPGDPANLTSTTAASGGSNAGTYAYQWESSTDGVSFNTIGGATATTYNPPAGLTQTTHYRRRVTSGVCSADGSDAGSDPDNLAYSNVIIVTVHQENNAGTIGNPQIICTGDDPTALTNDASASGGDGTNYVYQWQQATALGGPYSDIAGQTGTTYDPPVLTATTFYRRRVRSPGPVTTTCSEAFTTPVEITVGPRPSATVAGGGAACDGNPAPDIIWTFSGATSYSFTIDRPGALTDIVVTNHTTATYTLSGQDEPGSYVITALSNFATGCTGTSLGGAATVTSSGGSPDVDGTPSISPAEVCINGTSATDPVLSLKLMAAFANTNGFILNYTINGGANSTKTFNTDATGLPTAAMSFTETALNSVGTHTIRLVSIQSPTGCLEPVGLNLTYIVRPLPVIGTQPTAQEVCVNNNTSFTAAATTAGATSTNFQWQVSTSGSGGPFTDLTNTAPYSNVTTATLSITGATAALNGNFYRAVATGVFPTTFSCPVNSNAVALTVRPYATITVQPPTRNICSGATTTFGVTASVTAPSTITGYQWQISTAGAGGPYSDLTNVAPYSNVTTATMTITGATTALNGNHYRVVVTTTGSCPLPSDPGLLTVNPLPTSNAISPIVCQDITHVLGSTSIGGLQASDVDLTQFSAALADLPGGAVEVPPGFEVKYYDDSGYTSEITGLTTITNGQQVFTRVINSSTLCYTNRTITFTLRNQPTPANVTAQVCEDNPPGSSAATGIDLTSYEAAITGGAANRNVEWYTDQALTALIDPGALPLQEENYTISATTTFFAKIIDTTPGTPGCHSIAELKLEYQPRPDDNTIRDGAGVPVGSSYTVCQSNNLIILQVDPSINPGASYSWNLPTPPASSTDPGYFEILTPTDTYYVILRFPSLNPSPGIPISVTETLGTAGCAGTTINTSVIVEGTPPARVISGPPTVCANSVATYSVPAFAGDDEYTWTIPSGATITSASPLSSPTIDVLMSTSNGDITVAVSNSAGCETPPSSPYAVAVVSKPSMTSSNASTLCSGQAPDDVHTLTASLGGTTYRWEIINISGFVNGVSVGDTDGSVVGSNTPGVANIDGRTLTNSSGVNALVIYRVIPVSAPVSGVYCEGNLQNVTITIRPEPSLLLAPKIVCSDEPANYEITLATVGLPTGTQFSWSAPVMSDGSTQGTAGTNVPAGGGGTIHINDDFLNTSPAAITATYTINAVSGAGCASSQSVADRQVVITINPKPLIATTLDKVVCSDEPIALTLATDPASATAVDYDIMSRAVAGLLISHPGNADVPMSNVTANYLSNDIYTNTTGGPLIVTYVVNARSTVGNCKGPDQLITITINTGPSTNSVTDEVCSDVAGGDTYVEDLTSLQPLVNPDGTLIYEWYTDAAATMPIATPTAYPLEDGEAVYVKVHNGAGTCAKIQPVEYVVNPTPAAVTANISSFYNGFNVRCIGSTDGSITADPATLGTANYTYSIDGSNFFTGRIFNGLAASNNPFIVTVRDAKGCTATSAPMTLTEPTSVTAIANVTSGSLPTHNGRDLSCPGTSDGRINVTPGGGTGSGYSYRVVETSATNTIGEFNGLSQGSYRVTVTDANGCSKTSDPVTITPPPAIVVSATMTDAASCNGASDGEILVVASGGTLVGPNYTITLNPGAIADDANDGVINGIFTGLPASAVPYEATVVDDNGCSVASNGVVVTQPAAISAFISVNTSLYPGGSAISCFGANDAQLNVQANGGNGGYDYVLNVVTPGTANATGDITGTYDDVHPGAYTATVTDSRGCNITSGQVTVAEPADINVQQFIASAITCNGEDDGQIRLVASGGTGAFTYTRTDGPPLPALPEANGTGIFSGLSAFNYPFDVNDINGCTKNLSVALTEPDVVVLSGDVSSSYNGADISCPTSTNGIIQLLTVGGNGNYSYSITSPSPSLPNTTGIFNNMGAGTYTFLVEDPKGCSDTHDVTIDPPPNVTITAPAKFDYNGQDISCTNATDAIITVAAGGGTLSLTPPTPPNYTYVLTPASTNISGREDGSFENVAPGTYTITASDANGCPITSASITINPYAAITFPGTADIVHPGGTEIRCFGESNGQITSTPGGGAGSWTNFTISPAPGTAVSDGNGGFTGLPAGTYVISAQDANLCPASTASITVHQPDVLVASASVISSPTCFDASNASVRASAVGGTANYIFSINTTPSATTTLVIPSPHTFTGLAPNPAYVVTVTDRNGCTDDATVAPITAPSQPVITASVTSDYHGEDISCFGASDAVIVAVHTPGTGTGSLTYALAGNTSGQFTGTFSQVGPGTSTITATDINGCAAVPVDVPVTQPLQLQATLSRGPGFSGFDVPCFNDLKGVIIVTPAGGTGDPYSPTDFEYVLMQSPSSAAIITPGAPGDVRFEDLRAGITYQARVKDLNECTIVTSSLTLIQPTQITVAADITSNYGADGTDISCNGANDGQITVHTISGGAAAGGVPGSPIAGSVISDYTYTIDPADNASGLTTGVFDGLGEKLYTVIATDVNGCTGRANPLYLQQPIPLNAGFIGSSHDICINQANKTTQQFTEFQEVFGGNGSYEYEWLQSKVANPSYPADYTSATGGTNSPLYTAPDTLATTTTYIRTVKTTAATSALSCPTLASNSVTITVRPRPTVDILPAGPICQGTPYSVDFTFPVGTSPFTFDYDTLHTGSTNAPTLFPDNTGGTTRKIFINDHQEETMFSVTRVVDRYECEAQVFDQELVEIIKLTADFAITSPNPQCSGETFSFSYTLDPGVAYSFQWPDGTNSPIPAGTGTGTIDKVITSLNTGSNTEMPVILTATHTSCQPLTTSELITVYPAIIINVIPSAERLCSGTPLSVNNNTLGGQDHKWTVTRITGAGAPQIVEDPPSTQNAIDQSFTIHNTTDENPADYRVDYNVENDAARGSCMESTSFNISVYREAIAVIDEPTVGMWPGGSYPLTFGNDTDPYDTDDFDYTWTFSNNNANTPPVDVNGNDNEPLGVKDPTYTFLNPGTGKRAILNVINRQAEIDGVGGGCPSRDEFTFTINVPPLDADFTTSGSACLSLEGSAITVVNLSTGGNLAGADFISEWEVRDQTGGLVFPIVQQREPVFTITEPGRYFITLTVRNPDDATTPETHGPLVVDIFGNPLAAFTTYPVDMVFVPTDELKTDNRSSSATDPLDPTVRYPIYYQWDFDDGSDLVVSDVDPVSSDPDSGHSPTHRYTVEGIYEIELVAINDHGGGVICSDTATHSIQARTAGTTKVPNAFTPNTGGSNGGYDDPSGVSKNDVFLPITKGVVDFQMQIFDRWGNLVFQSLEKDRGWDGYDRNGNLMPAGVYVYKLVLRMANNQRTTQVGDVTLIR